MIQFPAASMPCRVESDLVFISTQAQFSRRAKANQSQKYFKDCIAADFLNNSFPTRSLRVNYLLCQNEGQLENKFTKAFLSLRGFAMGRLSSSIKPNQPFPVTKSPKTRCPSKSAASNKLWASLASRYSPCNS